VAVTAAGGIVAASAGCGLGLLLILQGLRGHQVLPDRRALLPPGWSLQTGALWLSLAVLAGLVVTAASRWPVAALAAAAGVLATPRLRAGRRAQEALVARTEAIASWAEMVRDNMAGAAGLEQALRASSTVAPTAIAAEVDRFVTRLGEVRLVEALAALGDDLDHPSGDLVIAALSNATRMEARELGPLLGRLAESIRADVRMHLRVEVGRARIRTSARIVVGVTAGLIALLFVTARDLLAAYSTIGGQLWLLLVLAVFAAGGWVMSYYSRVDLGPERFTARRVPTGLDQGDGGWP
jgi:Flp pilus assembly protein TadB